MFIFFSLQTRNLPAYGILCKYYVYSPWNRSHGVRVLLYSSAWASYHWSSSGLNRQTTGHSSSIWVCVPIMPTPDTSAVTENHTATVSFIYSSRVAVSEEHVLTWEQLFNTLKMCSTCSALLLWKVQNDCSHCSHVTNNSHLNHTIFWYRN